MNHSKIHGFNLLELLLVLTLIGCLTAIMLPNYRSYIRQSNRRQAELLMFKIMSNRKQAKTSLSTNRYSYHLSLNLSKEGLYVNAEPLGSQKQDLCHTLTLNSLGQRYPEENQCW